MSPKEVATEKRTQEQMQNSAVERKGTELKRSIDRENTVLIVPTNPALTFAVVTIRTSESPTHSTATPPSPRSTYPARKLASVSVRPLAVPVMSSPRPSFSPRSCLRFAFGVGPRRVLADGVATGGSHCMSLASDTSSTPALRDGCQSPSCPASAPSSAQSAACRKRQRSLTTLRGLGA